MKREGRGDKGDKGDVGDAGKDAVAKNGYFQGTITGTRRDGTSISETFKYEYVKGIESFQYTNLDLLRYETLEDAIVNAPGKGLVEFSLTSVNNVLTPTQFGLNYVKEIDSDRLFQLAATPYISFAIDNNSLIELSPEQNCIYNFIFKQSGILSINQEDIDNDKVDENTLRTDIIGGSSYFLAYDAAAGTLKAMIDSDKNPILSGALYDKYNSIKLIDVGDPQFPGMGFVNASDNTPLYEFVTTIPKDILSITNYTQTNGVITFDFHITVSKYRGYVQLFDRGIWTPAGNNTTWHDLNITGSFDSGGKVYKEIVNRKG